MSILSYVLGLVLDDSSGKLERRGNIYKVWYLVFDVFRLSGSNLAPLSYEIPQLRD